VRRFPLSLSQQNILSLERALPGTSVNNISTTVRIKGNLDFTESEVNDDFLKNILIEG